MQQRRQRAYCCVVTRRFNSLGAKRWEGPCDGQICPWKNRPLSRQEPFKSSPGAIDRVDSWSLIPVSVDQSSTQIFSHMYVVHNDCDCITLFSLWVASLTKAVAFLFSLRLALRLHGSNERMNEQYKCFWYIILSAIEDDEETQKRGIVAIVWWMYHPLQLDPEFDSDLRNETILSLQWLPMRPYSSTHVCMDDNYSMMKRILSRFMMAVSPKEMRYGIQVHHGSYTEVTYRLLSYGIPVDEFPVTISGVVKTKDFGRWIRRRQYKDEYLAWKEATLRGEISLATMGNDGSQSSLSFSFLFGTEKIDLPTNRDVLLGTGKFLNKHPGNQTFRAAVKAMAESYDSSSSAKQKAEITGGIVRYIQNQPGGGGRFLKRETSTEHIGSGGSFSSRKEEDCWWVIVSDQEARVKTGKAFNTLKTARVREEKHKKNGGQATASMKPISGGSSLHNHGATGSTNSPLSTFNLAGLHPSHAALRHPPSEAPADTRVESGVLWNGRDGNHHGAATITDDHSTNNQRLQVGDRSNMYCGEEIEENAWDPSICFGSFCGSPSSASRKDLLPSEGNNNYNFNAQDLIWGQNEMHTSFPNKAGEFNYAL